MSGMYTTRIITASIAAIGIAALTACGTNDTDTTASKPEPVVVTVTSTLPSNSTPTETSTTTPETSNSSSSDSSLEDLVAAAFTGTAQNYYNHMTTRCQNITDMYGGIPFLEAYWNPDTKILSVEEHDDGTATITTKRAGVEASTDTWVNINGEWKGDCRPEADGSIE